MTDFTPNDHFKWYIYWIVRRQQIFWSRYNHEDLSHTKDPILQQYKFTNVYRVLDRSSQYLLRNVIYNGQFYTREDMFWRIILYKHFNLPSTWEYLIETLGDITLDTPWKDIVRILTDYHNDHHPIYSNAYMLTASFMKNDAIKQRCGIPRGVTDKHHAYMCIFQTQLIDNGFYLDILNAKTFKEAFDMLHTIVTVGDFLAYQYVQDLNYSTIYNFNNNDFCSAGFGTVRGIDRTFDIIGKPEYGAIVMYVHRNFKNLLREYNMWGRFTPIASNWYPQVADLSNCFCETDKYLRAKGINTLDKIIKGTKMKNYFTPNPTPIDKYIFPPKWGINNLTNDY